ncbi:hypothetical protein VKI21_15015 [Cyanobacterium aponinum UTEX 3222]|uniref:hypothetical protein n=1 Tax=Cyanobacterium aponinum TaxID=379064 RepID=UPI00308AFF3E|nr:hypothetical protein VKI21_15015 [Cyanobacterium aponinum UTEX 3222]
MGRNRFDETWHRLIEWTNGQTVAERLAAQIVLSEGYQEFDPSHPLGGKDGLKDAICQKNGKKWLVAVYFPRGQQDFKLIQNKFEDDFLGVEKNQVDNFIFVTNQELRLGERKKLREIGTPIETEIYHLERITAILDQPKMREIRKQFLCIDFDESNVTNNYHSYNVSHNPSQKIIRITENELVRGIKTVTYIEYDPFTQTETIIGTRLGL